MFAYIVNIPNKLQQIYVIYAQSNWAYPNSTQYIYVLAAIQKKTINKKYTTKRYTINLSIESYD